MDGETLNRSDVFSVQETQEQCWVFVSELCSEDLGGGLSCYRKSRDE